MSQVVETGTTFGQQPTARSGSLDGAALMATMASQAVVGTSTLQTPVVDTEFRFTGQGARGLTFERRWTTPGIHPYDEITWEMRTANISNESGKTVFEQTDIEVPAFWSQLATNVVVSKYFRGHIGTPGREKSVKQLIDRVVNTITAWAATQHYFATDEDLQAFKAELTHLLVHQKMAFNSPVWFNVGVEERPQCSACQPYRAMVSTPDGMVPIGQLVQEGAIGRHVYDASGVTRIVAVKSNGLKPVLRVRLRNGNFIEATPDHVVRAVKTRRTAPEWLRVDELAPGMRLHLYPHRAKSTLPARVAVGASAGASMGSRVGASTSDDLDTTGAFDLGDGSTSVARAEAALAGWLQADGFVGQYEHGTNRSLTIEFQVANDDEYDWVIENLDIAMPGLHRHVRDADTKSIRVRRIRLYGEVLRDFVERWHLLQRGVDIRVPSQLWTASYDEICAYLRSVFQADGYVTLRRGAHDESGKIGFAVIGEQWTEDIQLLLNAIGIFSRRTHKREPREDRHDMHEVFIAIGSERARFAELVGFVGRDKQARLLETLTLRGLKSCANLREEEIVAIDELGVEEVYDIQTESGEYLSNNVAVHNCFINSVQDSMSSIMDLAKTEAMLFKYGSGAGVNLSPIRGSKEKMSGGGIASGPVSFMKGFDAFAGVVKCLTADTYVVTTDGMLRIEEAIPTAGPEGFETSDAVTLNTPAGPTTISQIYRSPLAATRSIGLRSGLRLTGTYEHPVLTLNKDFQLAWTKLADVRPGTRVAVERSRELWPTHVPSLSDFRETYTHQKRQLRYPEEVTPELARLLGYLVSEGSVEAERFRFSSADPEIMADFCACIEAVFGVDPSAQVTGRVHPTTGVSTEQITLSWKGALQFLDFCGLPAGLSATKAVPVAIRRSPRSLVLAFLGAYVEGDGHIGKRSIEIASASDWLLEEIQLLALNMGVVGRRSTIQGYGRLAFLGDEAARLSRLLLPHLVTPRKHMATRAFMAPAAGRRNPNLDVIPGLVTALRTLFTTSNGWAHTPSGAAVQTGFGVFNRLGDNVSYARAAEVTGLVESVSRISPALGETVRAVIDDHYLWDEVVTARDAGMALTYDFTVPGVHAFVSNGIVSHNSGGKTRRAAKMVILDADHPDVMEFIESKVNEEKKAWALIEAGYDASFTGEAYGSVFFQNANHSVRVTDDFMGAVESDADWTTREVTSKDVVDTLPARTVFRKMAEAAWLCGDPGIQYDTVINDWHTSAVSDRIYASNPCSEYMFLNDTACFAPETRISTPDGLRSIVELFHAQERGEQVLVTTDLHAEQDHRRITAHRPAVVTEVGERPVFRMRLADGREIRTTGDHRFLTGDGQWKELQDLRIGHDRVAIRESGNPVAFGSSRQDVDRWQMLGWMTGDGVFSKDTAALVFGPTERSTADWMEGEFQSLVAEARAREATVEAVELDMSRGALLTQAGVQTRAKGRTSHISTQWNGVMQISSGSGAVVRMLEDRYGFKQGTATAKDVPSEVHRIPDDLKAAYLQGLFSADGTIRQAASATEPEVMLASSSPALLRSVQLLLSDMGITSRISWMHPTGRKNPQGQLHIYNQQARAFMALVGFPCSETKQAKVDDIIAGPFMGALKEPRAAKVTAIEPDGVETVYDITEPFTHSVVAEGMIAHNCNLASMNLMKFVGEDGEFDVEAYRFASRVTITAQEILVDNASYPTPQIEENSHRFRPLGIGYANLGALLMSRGLAYDSDAGREYAATLTAIMTGEAYRQSAVIARDHGGPFNDYALNEVPFLRVIGKHRDAAYALPDDGAPQPLIDAARLTWDEALELGRQYGYRNAQVSVLAPTGCLVGNSMLLTDRGLVRLRGLGNPDGDKWQDLDLRVGTDDGPRAATKFFVNGAEPVVTVSTHRGYEVQGTTMHRIKVVDASGSWQWRRFSDVRPGDRVPLMLGGMIGEPREVPLPPLAEAYWTSDHTTFVPRAMSADLAELVGYFMGDGSMHAKGLRFCVDAKDTDVVERLVDLGRRLFGLDAAVTAKQGYVEVAYHSVRLTLWWEACGFAKHQPTAAHRGKGYEAHIPDAILYTNDPAVYRAFVRGLFEADGNTNHDYASWTTVSTEFSHDIQTMLLALGFVTTRKIEQPTQGHLGTNPLNVLRLLNANAGGRFIAEISFISERKRNALQLAVHQQAARYDWIPVSRSTVDRLAPGNDSLRKTMLMSLARTGMVSRRAATSLLERTADPELAQNLGYFYDEVTSAELGAEQLTYDISVPSNVTYVANGFVSHNTIAFMMDCDTTGIEPDIALVKYKKLVGEGFLKIVNNTVPAALRKLGYSPEETEDIVRYINERETIEGAPALKPEHLDVFDCAFKPVNGERSIGYMGHVRMMGATQPFLSGAISKTVNMPEAATAEDIEDVYLQGWKLGLKAIAIYRDGSKRSQPLSTGKKKTDDSADSQAAVAAASSNLGLTGEPKAYRRRLPAERAAVTHKFQIAGHEGYITVGLYEDGQPGELFLRMAKEGSTISGLMDTIATMTSVSLQYGVPLRDLVNKFAHVRFEPAGFTGNNEIPIAKSIVDYVFRWMGSRFLPSDEREALGLIGAAPVGAFGFGGALAPTPSVGEPTSPPASAHAPLGASASGTSEPSRAEDSHSLQQAAPPAADPAASTAPTLPVLNGSGKSNGHGTGVATASLGATTKVSFSVSADSPSCADCGSIMVRNGSCYKCLNCGSTSGCS